MGEKINYRILNLAFLGDSVIEVYVREYLVKKCDVKINKLHDMSINIVSATGQSKIYKNIKEYLNDEELVILQKGKNAKKKIPRNADSKEYQKATAIEALFGYLYIEKKIERIEELMNIVFDVFEEEL